MNPAPPRVSTVNELCSLLGEFMHFGFETCSLRVRTVAVRWEGNWYNYATAALVQDGSAETSRQIRLRESVILHESFHPMTGRPRSSNLEAMLFSWQKSIAPSKPQVTFQESVNLTRAWSVGRTDSWPAWTPVLQAPGTVRPGVPEGPFLDTEIGLFAPDVPRLACQFLGDSRWMGQWTSTDEYFICIPDRRVRIREIGIVDGSLRMALDRQTESPLYLCLCATSRSNHVFNHVSPLLGNEATVDFPFDPRELTVWVTSETGYALDCYDENEHRASWGRDSAVLHPPPHLSKAPLLETLAQGENDRVEFKPYIQLRPTRHLKSKEILKSVSALANSTGGSILLGVTDEAEPRGIDEELGRDYGKECREDLECQRATYVRDLKKLINEGATPTVSLNFDWHDFAHLHILEIRVPNSQLTVHLAETGEIYKRVGATNRKVRPSDALSESARSTEARTKQNPFSLDSN
jgi:hypothetical protein